jgi:hypothetical protein
MIGATNNSVRLLSDACGALAPLVRFLLSLMSFARGSRAWERRRGAQGSTRVRGRWIPGLLMCSAAIGHLAFADAAAQGFGSPVRIFATWGGGGELAQYTDRELDYIVPRVARIAGTDNHGYEFPGAIDRVLAVNPAASVSCSWDTMSVQPYGVRWTEMNPHEEAFIHSADPASLRVVPGMAGGAYIAFRIDGRGLQYAPYEQPLEVDRYLVEWGPSPEGPFYLIQEVVEELRSWIHVVEDPDHQPDRYYRVRTQLSDQTVHPYSWVASLDVSADAHFAYGLLLHDGSMYAACVGAGCPADPAEVTIEADRNHNRRIDAACEPDRQGKFADQPKGCESWRFSQARPTSEGFRYSGSFAGFDGFYDYRVVLAGDPSVAVPSGSERYQVSGNNNRIHLHLFGNYLIWPDDPRFQAQSRKRLTDCLDNGFTGMRLDYAIADLAPSWVASGLPPDWATGANLRLVDGVASQLAGLQKHEGTAEISINGYRATGDPEAYYRFIEPISGGEIEWFAFGNHPGAATVHSNVFDDLRSMIRTASMGKQTVAQVGGLGPKGPEDHDARRKSLALYLLVADESNYYHFTTDHYYRTIEYYPEWDLPLGNPHVPLASMTTSDLNPFGVQGLLGREFENGWTMFNAGAGPAVIHFGTPVYQVTLSGGRVPELGGDGALLYTEVSELVVDAGDGALVLKSVP